MRSLLPASLMIALPAVAFAQAAPATEDVLHAPGFVTLDRLDATSRLGGEVAYLALEGASTGVRLDVHGHYVDPATGFGGYATLPVTYLDAEGDSTTELGNLELGGLWLTHVAPHLGLVVRGGITLPTSRFVDVRQRAVVGYGRLADLVDALPDSTSIRLSVAPVFRRGPVFGRVDLGLDLIVDEAPEDRATLLRLQPGVGVTRSGVAVMGELVVLRNARETISTAALTARFTVGTSEPYVALVVPLDDSIQQLLDLAVIAGIEGRM